jgi:hypothetical protein
MRVISGFHGDIYGPKAQMVKFNPKDMRVIQNSIAGHFSAPCEGLCLEEVREKLDNGLIKSSDFPSMEVQQREGNRRLGGFRNTGLSSVQTNLSSKSLFMIPSPGAKRQEMARPDHFPTVLSAGGGIGMGSASPPANHNIQLQLLLVRGVRFGSTK